MRKSPISRRRFLVAAIALTGTSSGTIGPSALQFSRAWAQAGATLDASSLAALAQLARRLYPHDAVADAIYAEILNDALAATASDGSFARLLDEAEAALNEQQSVDFLDLDEAGQIRAMQRVEQADFFAAIRAEVRLRVYANPAVWAAIDYEGPSFQRGGYLNRGAGRIDWLPEEG